MSESRRSQPETGLGPIWAELICVYEKSLIFTEQLFAVFDEADEHDDGGPSQADKEHDFEDLHGQ